jgi:hypothetical protein
MKKIIGAASVITTIFLSGCAGRAPQPVAVVQLQDRYANCAAIAAEVQANNQKVGDLGGEEGAKVGQNVAAGVAGLFIWPLWFAMDFQGAAGKEVSALQSRQQYLAVLAEERHCGSPSPTPPPQPAVAVAPAVVIAPVPLPPVAAGSPSPARAATADYPPPPNNFVPSVTPTVTGAAPDTNPYEQAQQQYRQAEQQYQHQLELQRAQQGR